MLHLDGFRWHGVNIPLQACHRVVALKGKALRWRIRSSSDWYKPSQVWGGLAEARSRLSGATVWSGDGSRAANRGYSDRLLILSWSCVDF
jgi:hypothetical protein